jgi:hypothetical protein
MHGPHWKHHFQQLFYCVHVCGRLHVTTTEPLLAISMFTEPFPSNGCLCCLSADMSQFVHVGVKIRLNS